MSDRLSMLWPTSGWSSDEWLGVKATWSFPMSQSGVAPDRIDELEHQLLAEMQRSVEEGLEAAFAGHSDPETRYEIEQIGSAAETFHGIFAWVQSISNELLVALLAEGAIRGYSVVAGYIKGRISSFRRDEDHHEVTAKFAFHPELLTKLCLEHAVQSYSIRSVDRCRWRRLSDKERAALKPTWPPNEQFWIEFESNGTGYRYRVDEQGIVHQHSVGEVERKQTELVPDVGLVPVARPLYRDPESGEVVSRWPSQDGMDRSEHIAIIAKLEADFGHPVEDWEFVERAGRIGPLVQRELQVAVEQAIADVLPGLTDLDAEAEHYQVGPMAGGVVEISHFIIELFQSRDALPAIIGNMSEAWVLYEIASRVRKHLKTWVSGFGDERLDVSIAYPPGVIAKLCEHHVREHLHPRADLTTEWHSLIANFYSGYVSPGRPTGVLEYLVLVKTASRAYRYRVRGDGTVISLWMQEGKREVQLATPTLFADEGSPS